MTQYIGIIGYPLKHSISPLFQQAALDYYGLDIRYQVWEEANIARAVERLRQPQSLGANVTVPYKEAIIPFLESLEPQAREIGAVNVVEKEAATGRLPTLSPEMSMRSIDGRPLSQLKGYNTDAYGFLQALKSEAKFDPRGKVSVLLGAGGVARAVGFALVGAGVSSLIIFNRTMERARSLADALRQRSNAEQAISARPWREDEMRRVLLLADLIVNCTTLGMRHSPEESRSPVSAELVPPGALVYDLVYNPVETPLIKEARKAGAQCLGGLSMLVYQGAASFEIWTGMKAPLDIMFQSAKRALE